MRTGSRPGLCSVPQCEKESSESDGRQSENVNPGKREGAKENYCRAERYKCEMFVDWVG